MINFEKLTKYDKARLSDLKDKMLLARDMYIVVVESLFLHDLEKPSSKSNYLNYEKWLRDDVGLQRRLKSLTKLYQKTYVKYQSFVEVLESEFHDGRY